MGKDRKCVGVVLNAKVNKRTSQNIVCGPLREVWFGSASTSLQHNSYPDYV